MLEILLLFIASFVAYFLWSRYGSFQSREQLGLSGPKPNWAFGNLIELAKGKDPSISLRKWRQQYGNIFAYYAGPRITICVCDLDMVKEILVTQFNNFSDRMEMLLMRRGVMKDGIIGLLGEEWNPIRSLISPTFSTNKLKQMQGVVCSRIKVFLNKMAEKSQSFDIYEIWSSAGTAEKVLTYGLRIVFDERKKTFKELQLTDEAVLGNSFTFLLAGYETTSAALGYTAWLLAKNPEAQKRLQDEVDERTTDATEVDYNIIRKMPYLEAVFKEALRVYPPIVNFVFRRCTNECTVNGIHFSPGLQVLIPVYLIHHDPEIWQNPEKFDPERFLGDKKYHPMAWLPFGGGPRNCIGVRFADMEYKVTLVKLLQRFTIEKGPDFQDPLPTVSTNALMRPVNGVFVKLTKR